MVKLIPSGIGSKRFEAIKCGDTIEAYGPLGEFIFNTTTTNRIILVSTSTGIGPFISMLEQLSNWLNSPLQRSIWFLHGSSDPDSHDYAVKYLNDFLKLL